MGIKVVETKEVEFEGERLSVPVKVEINGKEYDVEENGLGEIHGLNIEDLKGLRLGDIPEPLELNCESTEIGWLRLQFCYASLEISEKPKYWRGNISIDNYFKLLENFAFKNWFEVVDKVDDDNLYLIMLGRMFPKETEVEEAYNAFKRLVDKVGRVVKIADVFINGIISLTSVEQNLT